MTEAKRPSMLWKPWDSLRATLRPPTPPSAATPAGGLGPALPVFVPPGHFYSPMPSLEDIAAVAARSNDSPSYGGIDLRETEQLDLLGQLVRFYAALPFRPDATQGLRYRFDNPSYSYADGIFLYSMLRQLRPHRLIEVGSGFTSALILDTNERFLDNSVECTFVEPHPQLLLSLMSADDRRRTTLLPNTLQQVDLALFDSLDRNDILLIDSTHVAKANSDVNRLFFEILPRLASGTMVHVHDVFATFEYPVDWFREGRAWNEQYVLRAFLQYNDNFQVRLFGNFMVTRHADWFRTNMPLCLRNPGGAFWMQKTQ
jgi:Methyltransferase domain